MDGLTQDLGDRDAALIEMQEHWNFLSFKHQLLIDMVRLTVLARGRFLTELLVAEVLA